MAPTRRTAPPLVVIVVIALSMGGCQGAPAGPPGDGALDLPPPLLLASFQERVPLATCRSLAGPGPVRSLTPAGRERYLALDASGTRVQLLGPSLEPLGPSRHLLPGTSGAPGSPLRAFDAVDAWLVDDSMLVVVDGAGRRLHLFPGGMAPGGLPPSWMELPFHPHRGVPSREGFAVVSMGPSKGELVHLIRDGGAHPAGWIPTPPLQDGRLVLLTSALVPVPLSGGDVLFLHPLLIPRGYRVDGNGQVAAFPIPVPDGQGPRVGWAPAFPYREEVLMDLLATALEAAPDSRGDGVLLLTRTGVDRGSFREKAVIRTDGDLRPVEAVRLPVNALRVLGLGVSGGMAVEDLEGEWHECTGLAPLEVPSIHGPSEDGATQ